MPAESSSVITDDRVLVISRVFNAPRSLVYKAWTEPERIAQWFGPQGFKGEVIKMDARIGGSFRFYMRSPDGTDHWAQGVHHEIVEGERLVYTYAWADANGNATRPETLITVSFEDLGGDRTRLTFRQEVFESMTARDMHNSGWNSSFDRLAEYLATA
ncbi:MAG TPA: SRPBCC domain-containing protein [Candidatus Binataceae bacterium]|nr:SRPBCC domain-containing protein [Candidatus Binataceae bacterium]